MKMNIGLWIDHRKAVIVLESIAGKEIHIIQSDAGRQPGRIAGTRSTTSFEAQKVKADDVSQRRFTADLHYFYQDVVALVRHATSLLVFGPGEAKGELVRELEPAMPKGFPVAVETADRMTDRQITVHVCDFFKEANSAVPLH